MKLALLSVFLALPLTGCVHSTTAPLVPGAVNTFDQDSYQALLALQASLTSLNASYKANPTGLAALKPSLDQAATDYNLAYAAWTTYHAEATAANQATLTTALTKAQTDISSIKVTQ